MQFQYQVNKDDYIHLIKTNNKNNFMQKILINLSKRLQKCKYELIMSNSHYIQNPKTKNLNISISDDGINVISDICEISIGWTAIKSIKIKSNSSILIKFGLNKRIEIPLTSNAFKNEDEKSQLINAITNKLNAKNNDPLPLSISENTSLNLKFIYSQEDEEYFYKYEMGNSPRGKKVTRILQYMISIYFLILAIASCLTGSATLTLICILLAVLSYFCMKKSLKSKRYFKGLNKSCKKLLIKSKDNYDPKAEKNIILSDKGLYFHNVNVVIFIEWEKINNYDLIESNNYIGFSSNDSVIFWIPTHAFNSINEKDEFLRTVKT